MILSSREKAVFMLVKAKECNARERKRERPDQEKEGELERVGVQCATGLSVSREEEALLHSNQQVARRV